MFQRTHRYVMTRKSYCSAYLAGYFLPQAVVRKLFDTQSPSELLDEAMVLWMPGPKSFTGEDTVELHTHGSRYVLVDDLGLH